MRMAKGRVSSVATVIVFRGVVGSRVIPDLPKNSLMSSYSNLVPRAFPFSWGAAHHMEDPRGFITQYENVHENVLLGLAALSG